MKKEWNKNNIIKVLLWTLAYAALSILVMELGSIHPVFFVLYPVVSAIILPIPYLMAAKRVKAFGVPTVMTLVFALIVFAVGEMASYRWFVFIPMILLAEGARALFGYDSKKGLGISAFIMSFSTFAWAFPIWFMHDFTISEAVKEMPAGYAETLDGDDNMPPHLRHRFLGVVQNEADRMLRIVKDLLTLSRMDNRSMSWHFEWVDMENLLENR